MDLLADLNPPQREAVLHETGPLLVLAGAGSGKTRVLTRRIARLLQRGVHPGDLLAVTFTNKAAGEMRERVAGLMDGGQTPWWIGTFHSTCARLLRQHAEVVGLGRDFTIFDDDDQKRIVTQLLKEHGASERVTPRAVMSRIDRAKNAGVDPEMLPARDLVDDMTRRVYPAYRDRLAKENAVDFNDILLRVRDLLAHDDLGPRLRAKFQHVLVDEFQDTNRVQYELVRAFAAGTANLCVVGDDDQSIYGWRGAEPKNMFALEHDFPGTKIVKLEQNYRSTGNILAAANAIIAKNKVRHPKALWTERDEGHPILLEETLDERGEAVFVAQGIQGLVAEEGRELTDFAVLYRTHAQSRILEETFRARRIPYRIIGGLSFFQRREVKDATEYLRLLANPAADSAFERIVNVPTRGIGEATVDRVRLLAREGGTSLLEAARRAVAGQASAASAPLATAARRKLEAFVVLIDGLAEVVRGGAPVAEITSQVLERSGYAERITIDDKVDGEERLANLKELVAAAAAYDASDGVDAGGLRPLDEQGPSSPPNTLAGFLERIALYSAVDETVPARTVTLMTIHAAKGLEFPVVFLVGLEEGVFPSLREREVGGEPEEERRLAYVAITRAKERLIVSHAKTRRTYDEVRCNPPSRFLAELPAEVVAVRARARAAPPQPTYARFGRPTYDEHDQRTSVEDDEPHYVYDDDSQIEEPFTRGVKVRHRIFGLGTVEDGSGHGPDRKLTISFPGHGRKTIVARFVEPA